MTFDQAPRISRRALVSGLAATAVVAPFHGNVTAQHAVAAGQRPEAAPAAETIAVEYDQKAFLFSPVTLVGGVNNESVWERQATPGFPWHPVGVTGQSYTFTPRWRDVEASFRVRKGNGQVLAVYTIAKPVLEGIDPCTDPRVVPQAKGDGVTDDARALTAAARIALALNTGVDLNGRTYAIGSNVLIRNKCTAFFNGTLKQTTLSGTVVLAGKKSGLPQNVRGCVITDVNFLLRPEKTALAIAGHSASHVAIINCTFPNPESHGTAISLWNYFPTGNDVEEITIRGNKVTFIKAEERVSAAAIYVDAPVDYKDTKNITAYWMKYRECPEYRYVTKEVYIGANEIYGGYYGASLVSVGHSLVEANISTMNVRNISMQQGVHHTTVRDNKLSESRSSGIHLAFCSSDNLIQDNSITTGRCDPEWGEGLLQAYVGTNRNRFIGNEVRTTSERGCRWFIYSGVQVNGNEFRENKLSGPCVRAYICLEAAWDARCTHFVHRGSTQPALPEAIFDNYTGGDSEGNIIKFNTIDRPATVPPDPSGRPLAEGICLADISDSGTLWRLVRTVVMPNRYVGVARPIKPHHYVCS